MNMLKKISALFILLFLFLSIPLSALAEESPGNASSTPETQEENSPRNLFEFEVETASSTPEEDIEDMGSSTEGEVGTTTPPFETGSSTPDETATTTETYLNIEAGIALPNGCEVEDGVGAVHTFPEAISKQYLAICAFAEALEQNILENINFADFGFGLFIQSVNGITSEENEYWKLEHNGEGASVGTTELELMAGDTVSLALTQFDPLTFEETPVGDSVTLTIESLNPVFNNLILPNHCSVTDMSGAVHEFPKEDPAGGYIAVCAFAEALELGFATSIDFADFGFGLFIDNINGIIKPENSYWQLQINGSSASVGVAQANVEKGDVVSLVLTAFDPVTFEESPMEPAQSLSLSIIGLEPVPESGDPEDETGTSTPPDGGSGGSESENTRHNKLDVGKALEFLDSKQKSDGSFGSDLYTDWVALAVVAGKSQDPGIGNSLKNYLLNSEPSLSSITDYERRAMALMAMGISPYDGTRINYIEKIVESFDGDQIGDPGLVNDDIFALFPLLKAGYSQNDEIIKESVSFILSRQNSSGQWESPDLTGAAIQALSMVRGLPGTRNAIDEALDYLRLIQENNGGFGTNFGSSGTSWIMQALISAGEDIEGWEKEGKNPHDHLYSVQEEDGGVEDESRSTNDRVWATAYAIPAALEVPWEEILEDFSRPKTSQTGNTAEENDEEEDEEAPAKEEVEEILGVSTSTPEAEKAKEPPEESTAFENTSIYKPASLDSKLAHETRETEKPESESKKDDRVEILEEKNESLEPQERGGIQTEIKVLAIMGTLLALGGAFKLFKPQTP